MSRLGGRLAVLTVPPAALTTLLLTTLFLAAPARADGLQQCIDRAAAHGGVPPTCTKINGKWVANWPDDPSSGSGFEGIFVAFLVIGLLVAGATIAWRVSTAQKLARQSGLDPDVATQMALFSDDGLDATYLAASLRQPPATAPATPAPDPEPVRTRSVAERLSELAALRDEGVITADEHDRRRAAIIDQV